MVDPSTDQSLRDWVQRMADRFGAGGPGGPGGSAADAGAAAPARPGDAAAAAISEDQWTGLRTDFVQAIQIWCNGMQHVVNQFERDVGQRGADSDDVSLEATIVRNVVDEMLPAPAKLAKTIAEAPLNGLLRSIQSGNVTLRAFCSAWNSAFEAFKGSRAEHDAMFARSRAEWIRNRKGFEEVSNEISYLADSLPQGRNVRRAMLQAWVNSTQDEGFLIDEVQDIAGYFRVRISRLDERRWRLDGAVLDDTDEQHGVIATLQSEYGRGTPLERLPFPMRVFITHGIHNETTLATKGRSGSLAFQQGTRQVFDDWRRSGQAIPKTSDLSEETLLGG